MDTKHTLGDKGKIRVMVLSQGTPKIVRKLPKARREAWNKFFLRALRRNQLCQHHNLGQDIYTDV